VAAKLSIKIIQNKLINEITVVVSLPLIYRIILITNFCVIFQLVYVYFFYQTSLK